MQTVVTRTHILLFCSHLYNIIIRILCSAYSVIILCRHVISDRDTRGTHIIIFLFYIRMCVNLCFWRTYTTRGSKTRPSRARKKKTMKHALLRFLHESPQQSTPTEASTYIFILYRRNFFGTPLCTARARRQ